MAEITRIIDGYIRDGLGPVIKAAGYKKSGRTFRLRDEGCTRVVNVQASQWNSGAEGSFTINLGVYFPEMAQFLDWIPVTDEPSESDCLVRQRIGFLLPVGADFWWTVSPSSDRGVVVQQLTDAWSQYASPWLDTHDTLRAARVHVLGQNTPWWAAPPSLASHAPSAAEAHLVAYI